MGRAAGIRPISRGSSPTGMGFAKSIIGPLYTQLVVDTGFAVAGSHTLGGSGISTSAIAAGILTIASTTNVYYERPTFTAQPLTAGTYTVTFTISSYVAGSISITSSANADLSTGGNSRDGTTRTANGTYTENIVLLVNGYIGLRGQGAAIVNSMAIDNLTVTRAA